MSVDETEFRRVDLAMRRVISALSWRREYAENQGISERFVHAWTGEFVQREPGEKAFLTVYLVVTLPARIEALRVSGRVVA